MKRQKEMITVAIVLALLGVMAAARWINSQRIPSARAPLAAEKKHGNPTAPVKIVEYSDFQCSACAKGYRVLHEFLTKAPDKFLVEFRHFPIEDLHPHALRSAVYAECAARQDLFWPLQELLFLGQSQWSKEDVDAETYFKAYARSVQADMDQLDACLQDATVEAVILRDRAEARYRGVSATPTFFVNGKMAVGSTALREELNRYLLPDSREAGMP